MLCFPMCRFYHTRLLSEIKCRLQDVQHKDKTRGVRRSCEMWEVSMSQVHIKKTVFSEGEDQR